MSTMDPSGPSQPSQNQAYSTPGNPASKDPAERNQSNANAKDDAPQVDQRVPQQQSSSIDEATPTSMARGVRGAGQGEDARNLTDQEMGRSADVNAEQMGAPGEGKVAASVKDKGGAGGAGGASGLETDLDRKKAEQAPMRESVKAQKEKEVDVGGALGQRGGPANPVD